LGGHGIRPSAALVAKHAFHGLRAPIERAATADVPISFSPRLERFVEPMQEKIETAMRDVLGGKRPRGGARGATRGRRATGRDPPGGA
jgi:hypothetical protein